MEVNIVLQRISKLCAENHYSLYRLAKESGVAISTLSSLYTNNHYPSIPTLNRLCTGLHISLSDFFLIEPEPSLITEEDRVLINKFNNLSPSQKESLRAYIDGLSVK